MPGVWRAVAHNPGAVVVLHSPKGCAYLVRNMELSNYYRALACHETCAEQYSAPLIVSGLREEHAIFGGAVQLRQCLDYVVTSYRPKYIVIANSCVAGVIADDTAAVAAQAEKEWGIPVISIPGHGFLDDGYHAGFEQVGQALTERFMSWQPLQKDTVTLLGDGCPNTVDTLEMQDLLRAYGLRIHCHFPGYASLAAIRRVPASALNIILGGRPQSFACLRKLAVTMVARFGIPFFDYYYPVGWDGVKTWLTNLGHFLKRDAAVLAAVSQQEERLWPRLKEVQSRLKGMRTVLCIGRPLLHFDPVWVLEMLNMSKVSLLGVVLLDGLTRTQREELQRELSGQDVKVPSFTQDSGAELCKAAELVITTHELEIADQRQFFLPVLPPVGVGGLLQLLSKLKRLAQRSPDRGGIIYG
jgi:nitrogenase molybdenum-iron protein alpha chain